MTVVIVTEGQVKLTPVTALSFRAAQLPTGTPNIGITVPPLMDVQISQREMGDTLTSGVGLMGGQIQIYYTAPDAKLQELAFTDLSAGSRRWQSIDGLNVLRQRLRLVEPNLEPWLQNVWQAAALDGFKLPSLAPLAPDKAGLVVTGYGTLADSSFAEVLGYGVDWTTLVMKNLGPDVPVIINGADQLRGQFNLLKDVRNLGYDPEKARTPLADARYKGLSMRLLVRPDAALQSSAKMMQANLDQIGVKVEIVVVSGANMSKEVQSLINQGASFLVFELR